MESKNSEKTTIIKSVNSVITKQSEERNEQNIQQLKAISDIKYDKLSELEQQVLEELIDGLVKFYEKEEEKNPKLLSNRFFENVRIQIIKNNMKPQGDDKVNEEEVSQPEVNTIEPETKNTTVSEPDVKAPEPENKNTTISEPEVKANEQETTSSTVSKPEVKANEQETTSSTVSEPEVKANEQETTSSTVSEPESFNLEDIESFNKSIEDLRIIHKETLEKALLNCGDNKKVEKLDCSNKEDFDKIIKSIIDEFGVFLNQMYDNEMQRLSAWEDQEDAERFKSYYEIYNLKIVNHLIEKYNMEK